ncbi:hypothetical protein NM688_g5400 [Phlebia brevispora]|uniref:Uncharacterized protein n=1 Tax=Phlebia brevispora TaxID=194682 RepID=A0ACC1SW24_9APHY|nr:hypothetical protein NM688_g5400 [Phlebia brevispora]
MCGLHKMPGMSTQQGYGLIPGPSDVLPPAGDPVAECERIHAWWVTFILDKSWVVALSAPSMANEQEEGTVVDTPWPVPMDVYIQAASMRNNAVVGARRTVQRFLADVLADRELGSSHLSLLARAAALYERANYLATYADKSIPAGAYIDMPGLEAALASVDTSIERFKQTLPPVSAQDAQAHDLLLISGLTYAATIQLHRNFAARSATSMAKCLGAGHSIVRTAQILGPTSMAAPGGAGTARAGVVNPVIGLTSILRDHEGDLDGGVRSLRPRAALHAQLWGAVDRKPVAT